MSSHRGRPASHPTDAHGLVAYPGSSSLAPLAGRGGGGREVDCEGGEEEEALSGAEGGVHLSSQLSSSLVTVYLVSLQPLLLPNLPVPLPCGMDTRKAPRACPQGPPEILKLRLRDTDTLVGPHSLLASSGHTHLDTHMSTHVPPEAHANPDTRFYTHTPTHIPTCVHT